MARGPGGKGRRGHDGDDGYGGDASQPKAQSLPSQIKNKIKRAEATAKLRLEKKKEKKRRLKQRQKEEKEAQALGLPVPERPVPRTIENSREYDEAPAQPADATDEGAAAKPPHLHAPTAPAAEGAAVEDELTPHFNRERPTKVLITTCPRPTKIMYRFIRELLDVIPCAHFYERRSYHVKQIVQYATKRDFTAVIVINENQKMLNGMLLIALPEGPTAQFRISSLVLRKKIKHHGRPTSHFPELILNNFTTNLGHRIGRLLASIFPQDPQFRGRRVVTFHNQRDFIFFRHHRYVFDGDVTTVPAPQHNADGNPDTPHNGGKEGDDDVAHEMTDDPRSAEAITSVDDVHDGNGAGAGGGGGGGGHDGWSMSGEDGGENVRDENGTTEERKTKGKKKTKKKRKSEAEAEDVDELRINTHLQECGPRFTLRLVSLQRGTFDSKGGDYEWVRKRSTETSRRKFAL